MTFFQGCVFSIAGYLRKSSFEWFASIEDAGGKGSWSLDSSTTHVVASKEEAESGSFAVKKAEEFGCWLISEQYLQDCFDQGKRLPEVEYALGKIPTSPKISSASPENEVASASSSSGWDISSYPIPYPKPAGKVAKVAVQKHNSSDSKKWDERSYKVLRNAVLQVTDIQTNHNKYYAVELHASGDGASWRVFTHYGRTGDLEGNAESGQKECRFYSSLAEAELSFDLILHEKTGPKKGYRPVSLSNASIGSDLVRQYAASGSSAAGPSSSTSAAGSSTSNSSEPASKLSPELQRLITYLFEEANKALTKTLSAKITARGIETPLGILSLAQVGKGEELLMQLYEELKGGTEEFSAAKRDKVTELSGQFYTAIPHRIGRQKSDVQASVITDLTKWEEKMDLIQLMKDIITVVNEAAASGGDASALSALDNKYRALKCEIAPLKAGDRAFEDVARFVGDTQHASSDHSIKVRAVYALNRAAEKDNFRSDLNPRRALFHGSRACNWVGLLSRGILLPKVVVARGGKRTDAGMLGAGIYFGDRSTTASQYCYEGEQGTCFLAICRVALGQAKDFTVTDTSLMAAPSGFTATHGVSRSDDASSAFKDDEWVVYDANQQKLEYLVEFEKLPQPPAGSSAHPFNVSAPESPQQYNVFVQCGSSSLSTSSAASHSPLESVGYLDTASTVAGSYLGGYVDTTATPSSSAGYIDVSGPNDLPDSTAGYLGGSATPSSSTGYLGSSVTSSASSSAFSSASASTSAGLDLLPTALREQKLAEDRMRGFFAQDPHNSEIQDPHVHLINVYQTTASFSRQALTSDEQAIPVIGANMASSPVPIGQSAIHTRAEFNCAWNTLAAGAFSGLNWNNVFAAGGAVLGALQKGATPSQGADIDLFLYGLSAQEATAKLKHIYETVRGNMLSKGLVGSAVEPVVRTKNAVTILGAYPIRNIQVILRLYKSPAEVLLGFDVDSCCVGYDGADVWVVPRARRALTKGYNLVDLSRRSLSYEHRLWKYCKRGFRILVPGLDVNLVDNGLYTTDRKARGLARLLLLQWKGEHAGLSQQTQQKHSRHVPANVLASDPFTKEKLAEFQGASDDCDYSDVFIPWGPNWSPFRTLRMLTTKDKSLYFARKHKNPAGQFTSGHLVLTSWTSVLSGRPAWLSRYNGSTPTATISNDSLCRGPLSWIQHDPGRQGHALLTGSFHPLTADNWDQDAYASYGGVYGGPVPPYQPPQPVQSFVQPAPYNFGNKQAASKKATGKTMSKTKKKIPGRKPPGFSAAWGKPKEQKTAEAKKTSGKKIWGGAAKRSVAKKTAMRPTGGKAPRKQLATKAAVKSAVGPSTPWTTHNSGASPFNRHSTDATASPFTFASPDHHGATSATSTSSSSMEFFKQQFQQQQLQFGQLQQLIQQLATIQLTQMQAHMPQQQQQQQQQQLTSSFAPPVAASSTPALPAEAPKSPTAKLLLLVSMLAKGGKISPAQRIAIKDKILDNDPNVLCALDVFEAENDFEELADTFIRIADL